PCPTTPTTPAHAPGHGSVAGRVPHLPSDLRRAGPALLLRQGRERPRRRAILSEPARLRRPVHGAARILTVPRNPERPPHGRRAAQSAPRGPLVGDPYRRVSGKRSDVRRRHLLRGPHERSVLPPDPPGPYALQGRGRVHRRGLPAGETPPEGRGHRDDRPRGVVTAESLARTVARDRRPAPAGPTDARRYVNQWVEREALGADEVSAFVLILRTRGCYWADEKGCSMCGYSKDTLGRSATPDELAEQLAHATARYRGEPYVKVYTSGSFLDDREVDPESRLRLVEAFSGTARRLLFETLPEFAVAERLEPLRSAFSGEIEVALGLESTDPTVLGKYIHKNAPPSEYLAAGDRVRALGLRAKAYLLLKPPYLTEGEAIDDVVRSTREAADHFDALSANPVHIQNGTVVEWLFRRGRYRPPWLWSVVESLKAGAALRRNARLVSFPTAGGVSRGPHNCGECDARVLRAIEEASLSQEFAPLGDLECACRAAWEAERTFAPLGVEA